MHSLSILSYVATALVLLSVYYISKPRLRGQYLILMADMCWLVYSLSIHSYGLAVQSVALMCISISAIRNWSRQKIAF